MFQNGNSRWELGIDQHRCEVQDSWASEEADR